MHTQPRFGVLPDIAMVTQARVASLQRDTWDWEHDYRNISSFVTWGWCPDKASFIVWLETSETFWLCRLCRHPCLFVQPRTVGPHLKVLVYFSAKTQTFCGFEDKFLCGFIQTNDTSDFFDWEWGEGGTPSQNTGPTGDHTCGSNKGK